MIDRSEVNRALAKAIAYKQCGKGTKTMEPLNATWGAHIMAIPTLIFSSVAECSRADVALAKYESETGDAVPYSISQDGKYLEFHSKADRDDAWARIGFGHSGLIVQR